MFVSACCLHMKYSPPSNNNSKTPGYPFGYPGVIYYRISVIQDAASIGNFLIAVVVRNIIILTHLTYKQSAGFHRGIKRFRKSARRIGIGAFLATGASSCGHRKNIAAFFSEFFGKLKEVLRIDFCDLHHRLEIIKTTDENGEICYLAPKKDASHHGSGTGFGFFKNLIHSVTHSVNIIVIHTAAGMAQGIAATIDRMGRADILGTIAGDDTIMVVCRTPEETGTVADYLKTHL